MRVNVQQYLTPEQRRIFEQKKNTRHAGRMSLRDHLRNLIEVIVPQYDSKVSKPTCAICGSSDIQIVGLSKGRMLCADCTEMIVQADPMFYTARRGYRD